MGVELGLADSPFLLQELQGMEPEVKEKLGKETGLGRREEERREVERTGQKDTQAGTSQGTNT